MYSKDNNLPFGFGIPQNYGGNAFSKSDMQSSTYTLKTKSGIERAEKRIYSRKIPKSLSPSYVSSVSKLSDSQENTPKDKNLLEEQKFHDDCDINLPSKKPFFVVTKGNDDLILLGLIILLLEQGTGKEILPILFMLLIFKK